MATDKRERQRANRQAKLERQEKAEQSDQRRGVIYTGAIIALAILGGAALFWFATRDDNPEVTGTDDQEIVDETTDELADEATATTTGEPVLESAVSLPEPGGTIDGEAECPADDGSSERITSFNAEPPMCIDATKSYSAVIETNLGDIAVDLFADKAPSTVNNFVFLSRYHYYEGAPFHRIIEDFMIQGGDAVGPAPGTGSPGYAIDEEPPEAGEYKVGSLAMAKTAAPKSTGSQFFIVTGAQGEALPPQYSLFGEVTEGMEVVESIEGIPTTPADAPTEEIVIESVTITES